MSLAEACEKQNEIIRLQSDIIDDLFLQLMQYVSIDREEKLIEAIYNVSELQANLLN